jgi:hypothetical protein
VILLAAFHLMVAPNAFSFFGNTPAGCPTQTACSTGYAGDGQLANSSTVRFNQPTSAAYDTLGNLFICDAGNRVIRKVDSAGIISTLPINASSGGLLQTPRTLAVDANNNLYIGDTTAFLIFKVTPGGTVTVIAGDGVLGQPSSDTVVLATSVSVYPYSIAYSSQANTLVILDPLFGKVRELDLVSGNIRTILGAGMNGPLQGAPSDKLTLGTTAMTSGLNSGWGSLTFCNGTNGLLISSTFSGYSGSPFGNVPSSGRSSSTRIHYCQFVGSISVSSTNTVLVSMRNWAIAFVPDGVITASVNVIASANNYVPFYDTAARGITADFDSGFLLLTHDDLDVRLSWRRLKTPGGYYSTTGWGTGTDMKACAPGYTSTNANGAISCTVCPTGKYSTSVASPTCTSCSVNTYSSTIGQVVPCSPCPYGTFSAAGSTFCSWCNPGSGQNGNAKFFNKTSGTCALCPVGTYFDNSGNGLGLIDPIAECTPIPAGSYMPLEGYYSFFNCNSPSPAGSTSLSNCNQTRPSNYIISADKTSWVPCPANTFVSPYYSPIPCDPCSNGIYGTTPGTGCPHKCPAGSFGTYDPITKRCSLCSAGTFKSNEGAGTCATCTGSSSTSEGASNCLVFPSRVTPNSAIRGTAINLHYYTTLSSPATIIAVNETSFSQVTSPALLTLASGENNGAFAISDPATDTAYVGTSTSPGKIVKVNLATLSKVGSTLTLNSGENLPSCAVFDVTNSLVIVGTATNPSILVLIDVSGGLASTTFPRLGALTLTTGNATGSTSNIPSLSSAVITGGYAYFVSTGTATSASVVVRVTLSTVATARTISSSSIQVLSLSTSDGSMSTLVIGSSATFLYAASRSVPATVVKIQLSSYTRVSSITLTDPSGAPDGAIVSSALGPASAPYLVFGTTTPVPFIVIASTKPSPRVVYVDETSFTRTAGYDLSGGYISAATLMASDLTGSSPVLFVGSGGVPGTNFHTKSEFTSFSMLACPAGSIRSEIWGTCTSCQPGTYVSGSSCASCPAGTYSPNFGTPSSNGCLACTPGTFSSDGASSCSACAPKDNSYTIKQINGNVFEATCARYKDANNRISHYYAAQPIISTTCSAVNGVWSPQPSCQLCPIAFEYANDKTRCLYSKVGLTIQNFANGIGQKWSTWDITHVAKVPGAFIDYVLVDAVANNIQRFNVKPNDQNDQYNQNRVITTVAGQTYSQANDVLKWHTGYAGDGQLANSSTVRFNQPTSAAYDTLGNLFICDAGNRVIRKVDSAGIISTLPINASSGGLLQTPRTLAVDANNNLYIGDTTAFLIFKVTPGGTVTVIAGDGVLGQPSSDTAVLATSVSVYPYSIAYSSQANTLVILDPLFGKVRELDLVSGNIRTILGAGMNGPMNEADSTVVPEMGATAMTSGLNSGWNFLNYCNETHGLAVPPYYGSPFGGNNNHYCKYPGGISVSSTNTVLVAMRRWIMAFTPDGIISFSTVGQDDYVLKGMFSYAIAPDDDGGLFVAKRGNAIWYRQRQPPGSYNPINNQWGNNYTLCPAGFISAFGQSSTCTPCGQPVWPSTTPGGEFSSTPGSSFCTKCPVNTFANATGLTSCYPCPLGLVQPSTGEKSCTSTCSAGSFFNQTTMSCMLCPAGSYTTTAMLTADPLVSCRLADVAWYVGSAGASSQAQCYGPNPTYSDVVGSTGCKHCPVGVYSAQGQGCSCLSGSTWSSLGYGTDATPCLACKTCNTGAGEVVSTACTYNADTICSCDVGYGKNTSGLCDKCPVNFYRLNAAQVNCTPCPYGGTAPAGIPFFGNNACNNPQNPPTSCSPGQQPWGSVCASCTTTYVSSPLHFCPGGVTNGQSFSNRPILCGSGKVPNANLSTCIWDGVTVCAAGSYVRVSTSPTDTYCTTCPTGSACAGGLASPVVCTSGQYIISNACATPTSCNPGDFVNATGCFPCPSGQACAGGVAAPAACTGGQIVNLAKSQCIAPQTSCSYGNFLYNSLCLPCPIGPSGVSIGCYGGMSSFTCNGFSYRIGDTNCGNCNDLTNTHCGGVAPCATCEWGSNGYYVQCAASYQFNTQQTACVSLPTTCPVGQAPINGVCSACPSGYYCPGGSTSGYATQAALCGTGKVPNVNATSCVWDGTSNCTAGTYINPSTASSAAYCIACPLGSSCAGGSVAPVACPSFLIVNNAASACIIPTSCYAGEFVNATGCFPCPPGQACAGGTASPVTCSSGQIPNSNKAACITPVSTCNVGQYLDGGSCLWCPNFACCYSYCPGGNKTFECQGNSIRLGNACVTCPNTLNYPNSCFNGILTCGTGYQKNIQGSDCLAIPTNCPAGQSSLYGLCSPCPSGNVCLGGSALASTCGTGKVPNGGATACDWDGTTVCAAGTYINPVTSPAVSYCTACPARSTCAGGSAAPVACASGQYANGAATACVIPTSCNVGDYIVGSTGCFPCPANSGCAGGTATAVTCTSGQVPNVAKSACVAAATTCNMGDFLYQGVCLTCPVVSGLTINCWGGSSGLQCGSNINLGTTCLPCPANANCWGSTVSCNNGFMLDSSGACVTLPNGPCQMGSYVSTTLSGIQVCDTCPAGKVCAGKGAAPITCPSPQVPDQLTGASLCQQPITTCPSYMMPGGVITNGICVNPSNNNPISCTGTPSTTLVTKCQTALTAGGVNATANIECGLSMATMTGEWKCFVQVSGQVCALGGSSLPSFAGPIMTALCSSSNSCGGGSPGQLGTYNFNGNGVSGGSCSPSGGGGGGNVL